MLFYTGLLFLVTAVSLDGFGVGVTYGIRKIHIPVFALCIIMLCSGVVVLLSMTIGTLLSSFISPHLAKVLGGCILIFLGIFSFVNIIRQKTIQQECKQDCSDSFNVLKVLSKPAKADLDCSGTISPDEALLLGVALALDAFGAGIGASIIGYSPLLTASLIAIMSGIFIYSGLQTGFIISKIKGLQHVTFIPPILLITLGIYNIL